jgi:hypothetical protein
MTEIHDDPMKEGAAVAVGLASELAGVVMATQSLQLRLIGLKPDKDAPLAEPEEELDLPELSTPALRTAQASARFNWQPALKDDWLAEASAVEAARAWSAALPFAEAEPSAALAMARSEARLAEINPQAMAGYQQLRAEGLSPADAMLEAAALFEKPPMGPQLSRDQLDASAGLSARAGASASAEKELVLDSPVSLGLENPISLNLQPSAHHASAAADAYDAVLDAPDLGAKRQGFEDDGPELGAELEDAPVLASSLTGDAAQAAAQEDLVLGAGSTPADAAPTLDAPELQAGAGATLDAAPDLQAGADAPTLSASAPQSEASRAAQISMRTFPEASAAAERTAQIQATARPQKKKTLSKVLKRGGRR